MAASYANEYYETRQLSPKRSGGRVDDRFVDDYTPLDSREDGKGDREFTARYSHIQQQGGGRAASTIINQRGADFGVYKAPPTPSSSYSPSSSLGPSSYPYAGVGGAHVSDPRRSSAAVAAQQNHLHQAASMLSASSSYYPSLYASTAAPPPPPPPPPQTTDLGHASLVAAGAAVPANGFWSGGIGSGAIIPSQQSSFTTMHPFTSISYANSVAPAARPDGIVRSPQRQRHSSPHVLSSLTRHGDGGSFDGGVVGGGEASAGVNVVHHHYYGGGGGGGEREGEEPAALGGGSGVAVVHNHHYGGTMASAAASQSRPPLQIAAAMNSSYPSSNPMANVSSDATTTTNSNSRPHPLTQPHTSPLPNRLYLEQLQQPVSYQKSFAAGAEGPSAAAGASFTAGRIHYTPLAASTSTSNASRGAGLNATLSAESLGIGASSSLGPIGMAHYAAAMGLPNHSISPSTSMGQPPQAHSASAFLNSTAPGDASYHHEGIGGNGYAHNNSTINENDTFYYGGEARDPALPSHIVHNRLAIKEQLDRSVSVMERELRAAHVRSLLAILQDDEARIRAAIESEQNRAVGSLADFSNVLSEVLHAYKIQREKHQRAVDEELASRAEALLRLHYTKVLRGEQHREKVAQEISTDRELVREQRASSVARSRSRTPHRNAAYSFGVASPSPFSRAQHSPAGRANSRQIEIDLSDAEERRQRSSAPRDRPDRIAPTYDHTASLSSYSRRLDETSAPSYASQPYKDRLETDTTARSPPKTRPLFTRRHSSTVSEREMRGAHRRYAGEGDDDDAYNYDGRGEKIYQHESSIRGEGPSSSVAHRRVALGELEKGIVKSSEELDRPRREEIERSILYHGQDEDLRERGGRGSHAVRGMRSLQHLRHSTPSSASASSTSTPVHPHAVRRKPPPPSSSYSEEGYGAAGEKKRAADLDRAEPLEDVAVSPFPLPISSLSSADELETSVSSSRGVRPALEIKHRLAAAERRASTEYRIANEERFRKSIAGSGTYQEGLCKERPFPQPPSTPPSSSATPSRSFIEKRGISSPSSSHGRDGSSIQSRGGGKREWEEMNTHSYFLRSAREGQGSRDGFALASPQRHEDRERSESEGRFPNAKRAQSARRIPSPDGGMPLRTPDRRSSSPHRGHRASLSPSGSRYTVTPPNSRVNSNKGPHLPPYSNRFADERPDPHEEPLDILEYRPSSALKRKDNIMQRATSNSTPARSVRFVD